jgi:transposase InsO family protein
MDLMDFSQGVPQNGRKYILQIIDVHTRFLTSYPLYNKRCSTIRDKFQQFLNEVIEPSGFEVNRLQTDAGGEFNGIEMRQLLEEHQIIHTNSTMPQTQGIVERVNRTIRGLLGRLGMANDHSIWFNLQKCVRIYNNTYHSTLNSTPQELLETEMNDEEAIQRRNFQQDILEKNNLNKHANRVINASQVLHTQTLTRAHTHTHTNTHTCTHTRKNTHTHT